MELTLRELNRTLLARQLLLERAKLPVPRAIERVGPLQAQYVPSPYVALWSRLDGLEKAALTRALERGLVTRSGMVRGTLHLTSRGDFPSFAAAYVASQTPRAERLGADLAKLRRAIGLEPIGRAETTTRTEAVVGTDDRWTIAFVLRALPWLSVPPAGTWGVHGAGEWIVWPETLPPVGEATELAVRRYLAAFGPATRDTPAPPRFLHSFDSAYLAHADKSRICAPEHEPLVYRKKNATMSPIFLVDGFVAGTWKIERTKKKATLVLRPFERVPRRELVAEGERLVRWHEDDATSYEVSVGAPA
jgi:hypothetical protein